jgi:hypothetical protein
MKDKRVRMILALGIIGGCLSSGCAVISNKRIKHGDTEIHRFSVLGVPLWSSVKSVDDEEE